MNMFYVLKQVNSCKYLIISKTAYWALPGFIYSASACWFKREQDKKAKTNKPCHPRLHSKPEWTERDEWTQNYSCTEDYGAGSITQVSDLAKRGP